VELIIDMCPQLGDKDLQQRFAEKINVLAEDYSTWKTGE
jgi:hypothetical protein